MLTQGKVLLRSVDLQAITVPSYPKPTQSYVKEGLTLGSICAASGVFQVFQHVAPVAQEETGVLALCVYLEGIVVPVQMRGSNFHPVIHLTQGWSCP